MGERVMANKPKEIVNRQIFFSEPRRELEGNRPPTKLSFDFGAIELSPDQIAQVRSEAVKAAMGAAARLLGRDDPIVIEESFSTFSTFSTFSSAV